ncbi:MAG: ABC transporter permease [Bacteroidales bacterium]
MSQFRRLLKTIFKYKLSSGLTLLSLIVAFLGIVILTLYISYERNFDNFHKNGKDIYRLSFKEIGCWANVPKKDIIQNNIPEVERSVIFSQWWSNMLYKEGQDKKDAIQTECLAASNDFFTMFDFPLIQGDPKNALNQPKTLVVSQSLAQKMFGRSDVMGESIMVREEPYKISGVMKDMPMNTAFKSDAIVSFETYMQGENWRGAQSSSEWSFYVFFQLKPGIKKDVAIAKMSRIKEIEEDLQYMKKSNPNAGVLLLEPLNELHYIGEGFGPYVNKKILNVLTILAIMLAIMGAVNFINFSTSQAPLRAKALSVQQILGERKWKARFQIIGESVLLSLVALGIALIIHRIAAPYIQNLFGIQGLEFTGRYIFLVLFVLFAVLFGVIAGFYPSRYITSLPMAQAVKGKMVFTGKGNGFRNTLITLQFVFTIALMASAFTIEKQLSFWRNFDIGINKENVIYLYTTREIQKHYKAFADELMQNREISDYTYTQFIPGQVGMGWGREVDGQAIRLKSWPVDDRFFDFFGIKIVEGRNFLKGESDINNFIFNEKAVKEFGWEKPLEKKMNGFDVTGNIIGVVKDFNFSSLKEEIEPMTFWLTNQRKYVIMLKAKTVNYTQLMKYITATAKKFDPENTVEPKFLDDSLNKLYDKETKMARLIESVAIWCVVLALTGLFGLIIFITRDKVKEIGIRKVNGAKVGEIVSMLNRNVIIWIGIAFVIATPLAWYAMDKWLENFAYKTNLSWWIFALAGVLALGIALLTVSWQSWRAATRNPVEALRYE